MLFVCLFAYVSPSSLTEFLDQSLRNLVLYQQLSKKVTTIRNTPKKFRKFLAPPFLRSVSYQRKI
jgi:hypothetical protein